MNVQGSGFREIQNDAVTRTTIVNTVVIVVLQIKNVRIHIRIY